MQCNVGRPHEIDVPTRNPQREEQDAERREAVNKAQEKLMEVGREVEDAASMQRE
jgi:hypothetical protein